MDLIAKRAPARFAGQGRPSFMNPANRPPSMSVSLRRLLPSASFVGCADIVASDVAEDSRQCRPGGVFAAIPGKTHTGSDFVPDALARGAIAVLTNHALPAAHVPQCVVPDVRAAYATVCHALYGYPSWRLGLIGVTGTNGKTTTTWLARSILESAGQPTGLLGTVEYSDSLQRSPARLTTPDSKTFAAWLSSMVASRARYAAVELSSHALEQYRCAGTLLDVAVVTNITRDHFDYHETAENYVAAKSKILQMVKRGGLVVLNADDPISAVLAQQIPATCQLRTIGLDAHADLSALITEESADGCQFTLRSGPEQVDVQTPLVGRHNVMNCLAAAAACQHLGLSLPQIAAGIRGVAFVPGRLERVDVGQDFSVYVDYAHTDDALRHAIQSLRRITPGRVFCVFGAGGDRDANKRPLMGEAATAADVMVVTSDNPRSEPPDRIIDDILRGTPDAAAQVHVEPNRSHAIGWAVRHARAGDAVLVAGKGHEQDQIVGSQRLSFDDRIECRSWLNRLHRSPHREMQQA